RLRRTFEIDLGGHPRLQLGVTRRGLEGLRVGDDDDVVVGQVAAALDQPIAGDLGDLPGHHRRAAVLERGEADAGRLIDVDVADLFRTDVRLDHQVVLARHDLGDGLARPDDRARGGELEVDDLAARGSQHDLTAGGVHGLAQLLLDLGQQRRGALDLIARHLDVVVLDGLHLQIGLHQSLRGARELRAPLLELARVVEHHRLELHDPHGGEVASLDELPVGVELAVLQGQRALRLGDLAAQGRDLVLDLLPLRLHQSQLAPQGVATRLEEGRLLHDGFVDAGITAGDGPQIAGEDEGRRQRLLGLVPDEGRALGIDPVGDAVAVGVHADVAQNEDRLPGFHALAVAHQDLAHDAALEVLDWAAIELDADDGGGHDGHGEGGNGHPDADGHDGAEDDPPAEPDQAPRVLLGGPRSLWADQGQLGGSRGPGVQRPHAALSSPLPGACCCMAFSTWTAGPNCWIRPAASTRILSTWAMRERRWVTTMEVTPLLRSAVRAWARATSPAPSRLELGSSRTTRRGLP